MKNNEEFKKERIRDTSRMSKDRELKAKSIDWMLHANKYKYSYNFSWLGRPIIKYPNDIVLMQEIIWDVKPDLIIETGIAHGGSIIFSASMLELIGEEGKVIGIDIDIRKHNRVEIEKHPMFKRITMLEGDCLSNNIIRIIKGIVADKKRVMVFLDSYHTHNHVLKELELYSPFVTIGSYLILADTFIEYFPRGHYAERSWDVGNNPMTALKIFLAKNNNFKIDKEREKKLMITESFDGYLKRIK